MPGACGSLLLSHLMTWHFLLRTASWSNIIPLLPHLQRSAREQQQTLIEAVAQADQQVAQLTAFLGEPPDTDPAQTLGTIWTFALSFDQTYRTVARLMAAMQED